MRHGSAASAAVAVLLIAFDANAHAFGARYDLPLPLGLYLAAAGAAVAASFLGATVFLRREETRTIHLDLAIPRWLGTAAAATLSLIGLATLAVLIGAAFLGPQEAVRNLATLFIWVVWWVGFLLFSALIVSLWPRLDPFRASAALATRAFGGEWKRTGMPAELGLLAPVGILAIAWIELISDWSEDPSALGILVAIYLAVSIIAGMTFGAEWFRTADPLGRTFDVLGRMAPIAFPDRTTIRLRPPAEGLLDPDPRPVGEAALICSLIGVVLFDGLSETPAWAWTLEFVSESQALRPGLLWMREQGVDLMKMLRSFGLFSTVLAFYGIYWVLILSMKSLVAFPKSASELARNFAGTLLPIAVAYHLSHYVSYLLVAGQLVFPAANDPFAQGWDLFGTSDWSIDVTVIAAEQVWWIAFVSLIVGHALSVLVGHRRALQVFGDPRQAAISQIPMIVAMVGLTVLSLWILSQPITE